MLHSLRDAAPRTVVAVSTCLAIAWLALPARTAAAAGGLTIADAVRRAVENAPQIVASRAAIEAASQDLRRAGRLPDPMLAIGIADLPVSGGDAFDTDADAMTEKTIGLQQDLPARAKRMAQRAVAARAVELAKAEAGGMRLDVERAAASAWVGAWSAARELEALGALRAQVQLALRLARARAAGGGSTLDVLAAEAAVLDLVGETAAVEGDSGEALAELQRWVGDGTQPIATDAPDFGRAPRTEAAAFAALDRQPALQAAAARTAAADAALDAARAGRRPDWNVAASYGQRSGFDDMLMLEVGVSLPFFTRNRQGPDIAARLAEQQGALARQESLQRELAARTRAGYAKWQGLKRQVEAHEQVLRLAGDRSAAALASYRAGGELRAWLDARRDEILAHRSHAQHRAALGRAWVELAYLYEEQVP